MDWRHDLVGAGYGSLREVEQVMTVDDVLRAMDAVAARGDIEHIIAEHQRQQAGE